MLADRFKTGCAASERGERERSGLDVAPEEQAEEKSGIVVFEHIHRMLGCRIEVERRLLQRSERLSAEFDVFESREFQDHFFDPRSFRMYDADREG